MIDHLVAGFFNEWIADRFKNQHEIRRYLALHERRQTCLNNIVEQIRIAELGNLGQRLDMRRVKMLAEAGAEIFAKAALDHAEQRALSQAERQRRIDSENVLEHARAELVDRDVIPDKPDKYRCD